MSKVSRIEWIDLLKGIAILWLILYHMHVFDWMRSPVPVFFFLSGLFFSEGKSFGSFIKKKANTLLVPLLFFFVLGVSATALKCVLQGEAYSFPSLWKFATLIPADAAVTNPLGVGAIWFLASLFEIYIIYYCLRMFSKKQWWLFVAGVLLYLTSCILMHYYAMGSLLYLFYSFGFCIFFIVAHQLRDKVICCKIPMWLISIAVAAYLVKFVDTGNVLFADDMGGGIFVKNQRTCFNVGADCVVNMAD
jgi:fucose 4-O-acetylase-like acetyltransferase